MLVISLEFVEIVCKYVIELGDKVVFSVSLLNKYGIVVLDILFYKVYDMLECIEYNVYIVEKVLVFDVLGIKKLVYDCELNYNLEE